MTQEWDIAHSNFRIFLDKELSEKFLRLNVRTTLMALNMP